MSGQIIHIPRRFCEATRPAQFVKPPDPREPDVMEDAYDGLPVLGHSEPIHLLALRGDLPADTCNACGHPVTLHYDTSGIYNLGCEGVPARLRFKALTTRPLRDPALWGDQNPGVSATVRDALRAACGPAMSIFFDTLPPEDRVAISRRIADLAVLAHYAEMKK